MTKTFGVTIEGRYGDKSGRIMPRFKSKRSVKRRAELMTVLAWFLKYARARRIRVVRKRDGSYAVR